MIRPTPALVHRCGSLTACAQRLCRNRARYRLRWGFPETVTPHKHDACAKHHRAAMRQLQNAGAGVACKLFGKIR